MGKTNNSTVPAFGMKDRLGYMFGDFGNDFTFILSSMFMMKFYTDVMGLSAGVVGMLMMAARFVDAFTDVTMGQIVDRSKPTKDGKFRPWIKRMCGPVAIASFLIYQSGLADMPYGVKVAYMVVTYLLWGSIFYTSINIPYGSMASAISPDPTDRASLSTWRSVGASLAGLVIGTGTPLVAYVTVDGNPVLSGSRMTIIAGVFSVLAVICYLLCYNLVREHVPGRQIIRNWILLLLERADHKPCSSRNYCGSTASASGNAGDAGNVRICIPKCVSKYTGTVGCSIVEQRSDHRDLCSACK